MDIEWILWPDRRVTKELLKGYYRITEALLYNHRSRSEEQYAKTYQRHTKTRIFKWLTEARPKKSVKNQTKSAGNEDFERAHRRTTEEIVKSTKETSKNADLLSGRKQSTNHQINKSKINSRVPIFFVAFWN